MPEVKANFLPAIVSAGQSCPSRFVSSGLLSYMSRCGGDPVRWITIIRFALAGSGGCFAAIGSAATAGTGAALVAAKSSCIAIAPMPPAIEPSRCRRVASSLCPRIGSMLSSPKSGFLTDT